MRNCDPLSILKVGRKDARLLRTAGPQPPTIREIVESRYRANPGSSVTATILSLNYCEVIIRKHIKDGRPEIETEIIKFKHA